MTKTDADRLSKGENYPRLNPAIALNITDLILFKNTATQKFEDLDRELQLIFVELPKFNQSQNWTF